MLRLGDLPGGFDIRAASVVSAYRMVVVGSSETDGGPPAFRWAQEGGMIAMGRFSVGHVSGRLDNSRVGILR